MEKKPDVIAVFDAGDLRFAGIDAIVNAIVPKPRLLNFDHHATNERFGEVNVLDVAASSTAEVVYRFMLSVDAPIDTGTAICLLTGIVTDTGGFTNGATTSGSLEAASALVRSGAKMQEVASRLVRNKPISALQLWGKALSRLKFNRRLGVASTVVLAGDLAQDGVEREHVEGISNFLNTFLDADVVLVLTEGGDGSVKGSFRTVGNIDVSQLARAFGGGGHKKAAGFTIRGKIAETPDGWRVE